MNRITILSVLFASVSALAGCGAHSSRAEPVSPTTTTSAVDCAPPPGGDMQFDFEGGGEKAASRSNAAATSFKSNAVEKPKSGAVHAAY